MTTPPAAPSPAPAARSWWQDRRRRTQVALVFFGVLAIGGILFPAFTKYLFAGDQRVLVVTMQQGVGQPVREALRASCGSLPGVRVIPDKGNPDPRVQGRFPVRFDIKDISAEQYSALTSCINRSEGVRGFLNERDGR